MTTQLIILPVMVVSIFETKMCVDLARVAVVLHIKIKSFDGIVVAGEIDVPGMGCPDSFVSSHPSVCKDDMKEKRLTPCDIQHRMED